MSDKARVLHHLREHGSITPLEALHEFGCMRLGARIWDLRHEGYDIVTDTVVAKDKNGERMSYARYVLRETDARA